MQPIPYNLVVPKSDGEQSHYPIFKESDYAAVERSCDILKGRNHYESGLLSCNNIILAHFIPEIMNETDDPMRAVIHGEMPSGYGETWGDERNWPNARVNDKRVKEHSLFPYTHTFTFNDGVSAQISTFWVRCRNHGYVYQIVDEVCEALGYRGSNDVVHVYEHIGGHSMDFGILKGSGYFADMVTLGLDA